MSARAAATLQLRMRGAAPARSFRRIAGANLAEARPVPFNQVKLTPGMRPQPAPFQHRRFRAESASGYRTLERACWRRRKGGYSRRLLRRARVASYLLPGSPVVANTCCTSLLSNAATSTSSVPLPP